MHEPLPLSRIQEAVLEFLQGRTDAVLFGAQAVNAYVSEPRATQDVDIMSTRASEFAEELRDRPTLNRHRTHEVGRNVARYDTHPKFALAKGGNRPEQRLRCERKRYEILRIPAADRPAVGDDRPKQRRDDEPEHHVGEQRRQHRSAIGRLPPEREARHCRVNPQFPHRLDTTGSSGDPNVTVNGYGDRVG